MLRFAVGDEGRTLVMLFRRSSGVNRTKQKTKMNAWRQGERPIDARSFDTLTRMAFSGHECLETRRGRGVFLA